MTPSTQSQVMRHAKPLVALTLMTVLSCGSELVIETETCRLELDILIDVPAGAIAYDDTTLAPAEGVVIDHMPPLRPPSRYRGKSPWPKKYPPSVERCLDSAL